MPARTPRARDATASSTALLGVGSVLETFLDVRAALAFKQKEKARRRVRSLQGGGMAGQTPMPALSPVRTGTCWAKATRGQGLVG